MKLLLIGCSTGGPGHLAKILGALPENYSACIVVAQHIAESFLPSLVQNFESECKLPLRICENRAILTSGSVNFAKGEHINEIFYRGNELIWSISEEKSTTYAPNINRLFASAARLTDKVESTIGVLLTGIGDDGAKGLLDLKLSGAKTIAESEESAVVYGMPRCAKEIDAADEILSLTQIVSKIVSYGK